MRIFCVKPSKVNMNESVLKLTKNQNKYVDLLKNSPGSIIIATGPAGSGKTMLACKEALSGIKDSKYDKIILTRPTVSVEDEQLGYLPGEMDSKMKPWMDPIFDQMIKNANKSLIGQYKKDGLLEIIPLAYIRGRTFDDSFIIADEMQNATIHQMKTLLTRIGMNTTMVITGDLDQSDNDLLSTSENGLENLCNILDKNEIKEIDEYIYRINLTHDDVMRSEIVKQILRLYENIK
jgi:phosphate starvation-inducible protein PhoH and related proteins